MKRSYFIILSATFFFFQSLATSGPLKGKECPGQALTVSSENITFVGGALLGAPATTFVVGNYLYVGAGMCLAIFDLSSPDTPVLLGQLYLPDRVEKLWVSYPYAYALTIDLIGVRITIIEVSNPRNPKQVGVYELQVSPYDVKPWQWDLRVDGERAYLSVGEHGLYIIGLSNKTNPITVGKYKIGGAVAGVSISNNFVYTLVETLGLVVVDVSNPQNPVEKGICAIAGTVSDIYGTQGRAYVSSYIAEKDSGMISVVDVSNPQQPKVLGWYLTSVSFPSPLGGPANIRAKDDNLYFTLPDGRFFILDVANPSHIKEVSHTHFTDFADGLSISGNSAYYAAYSQGLVVIDISKYTAPKLRANLNVDQVQGIAASDHFLYVADGKRGLRILDISNPTEPQEIGFWEGDTSGGFDTGFDFQDLDITGDFLYTLDPDGMIYVFNVANPYDPHRVRVYELRERAFSVDISGEYAFVTTGDWPGPYRLRIIDFSDPFNPRESGEFEIGSYPDIELSGAIRVSGNLAYIGTEGKGLMVIDVSDPSDPKKIGSFAPDQLVSVHFVNNHYAYVSIENELIVVDTSNPLNPLELDRIPIEIAAPIRSKDKWISGVYATDKYAFIRSADVIAVNVSNPTSLKEVCRSSRVYIMAALGLGKNIFLKGDYVYVANFNYGLAILKFTPTTSVDEKSTQSPTPERFTLSQNYPNPFNSETTITYQPPQAGKVNLKIYNLLGQVVHTLVEGLQKPGTHTAHWDGRDDRGRELPSGVYLYRLIATSAGRESFIHTRKMLLLK